jgi:hypothetical protein
MIEHGGGGKGASPYELFVVYRHAVVSDLLDC